MNPPNTFFTTCQLVKFTPILFFWFLPIKGFTQTGDAFYLEAYNKEDLTPINQTQNGKFIELEFADAQLTAIFDGLEILEYENAFEELTLCSDSGLDNVFEIRLNSPISVSFFQRNSLIKKVEPVLEVELAESLPDDYFIPTLDEANQHESPGDFIRNDYLDLIQAPCAWKLTKGDPNILVGV